MLSRWIGWNNGFRSAFGKPIPELAGIVGPIREQALGHRRAFQHLGRASQIMRITGCEDEGTRTAMLIGQRMDLCCTASARGADGVREGPPFAPAAERCALTYVESTAPLTTSRTPVRA